MTVVDTTELGRPTQRKLHAAWRELHGKQVLAPPAVARELAPLGADREHPTYAGAPAP